MEPPKKQKKLCGKGHDHQGLPIIMVCLEKDCARKRLCCLACIDQLHLKHEIISLKKFQNYLYSILNHNAMIKNRDQILGHIGKFRVIVRQNLQKARASFNSKIDEIINKSQAHFSFIEGSFANQKFRNVTQQIYDEFTDQKIQEYYKMAKKNQSNMVNSLQEVTKGIASTDKAINEKLALYVKQLDKNNDAISKTIEQFKITTSGPINKIKFNPDTKAACLVLQDNETKAKRGEGTGGYPIAIVNQPFTEMNNKVSFTILEEPANKGIWMGVCVLDIVKNFNYQSCYGLGKGTWAIDQVGQNHTSAYSWSHHDSTYNSAPKVGWQFVIGDIVTIQVDFVKSVAKFSKNNYAFQYEQPIKLDLGAIYAFAGPTNLNDVISIA